jgi:heterodisulfide reductase subunit C
MSDGGLCCSSCFKCIHYCLSFDRAVVHVVVFSFNATIIRYFQ